MILQHLEALESEFIKYFPEIDNDELGLIRNPIIWPVEKFPDSLQDEFLELKARRRRLKRYPLQVRHKQDWGRGFILLLPQTAALPGADAGSDVIKPASSFELILAQEIYSIKNQLLNFGL